MPYPMMGSMGLGNMGQAAIGGQPRPMPPRPMAPSPMAPGAMPAPPPQGAVQDQANSRYPQLASVTPDQIASYRAASPDQQMGMRTDAGLPAQLPGAQGHGGDYGWQRYQSGGQNFPVWGGSVPSNWQNMFPNRPDLSGINNSGSLFGGRNLMADMVRRRYAPMRTPPIMAPGQMPTTQVPPTTV